MKVKAYSRYLILIPIVVSVIIYSINFNKPFIGHHDFVPTFNANIAKNYLEHGYLNLKLGQAPSWIRGEVKDYKSYYTHYPPLFPILVSFSFLSFGISEGAVRVVSSLFGIIGVVSIYLICQRLWGIRVALFGSLFYLLTPMSVYFGNLGGIDPVIVHLSLFGLYFYLRWLDTNKRQDFLILILIILIGGLIGWQINYIAFLIVFHSLIIKRFNFKFLIPVFISLGSVILLFMHAFILTGSLFDSELLGSLRYRFADSQLSFGGTDFTYWNYIKQEFGFVQVFFTRVVLILSAIYLIFNFNLPINLKKATVLILLFFGLSHPVLFSRYVFVHDYLNIYLLPFLAVSAALGMSIIISKLEEIKTHRLIILGFIFLVFVLFLTERINFTFELMRSSMHKPGKDMAIILNRLQKENDEAVILSKRFDDFYGIYTKFYSKYFYSYSDEKTLSQMGQIGYKYIITIDEDIKDQNFYNELISRYMWEKEGDITIIYLK